MIINGTFKMQDAEKLLYTIAKQNKIPWMHLVQKNKRWVVHLDDNCLLIDMEKNFNKIKVEKLDKVHWMQSINKVKKCTYKEICLELYSIIYMYLQDPKFRDLNKENLKLDYNILTKEKLENIKDYKSKLNVLENIEDYENMYHEIINQYLNISKNASEVCRKFKKSLITLNNNETDYVYDCRGRLFKYRMVKFDEYKQLLIEIANDTEIENFKIILTQKQELKKLFIKLNVEGVVLNEQLQDKHLIINQENNKQLIFDDIVSMIRKTERKNNDKIAEVEKKYIENRKEITYFKNMINEHGVEKEKLLSDLNIVIDKIENNSKNISHLDLSYDNIILKLFEMNQWQIAVDKSQNKLNNDINLIKDELNYEITQNIEHYNKKFDLLEEKIEEIQLESSKFKEFIESELYVQNETLEIMEKKLESHEKSLNILNEIMQNMKEEIEEKHKESIQFINNRFESGNSNKNIEEQIASINLQNENMKEMFKSKEENLKKLEIKIEKLFEKKQESIVSQKEKIKMQTNSFNNKSFEQKIYSGAPGTGKSYKLKNDMDFLNYEHVRITFHPEYEYHNFVGSIQPFTKENNVFYKYNPGPFVEILKKALHNPGKSYALVIEEMTRANCSAVFGDIFQLLDRDENGWSMYHIVNREIYNELNVSIDKFIYDGNIKIPPNLSIYGTLNTSDQNTFSLDTAFKRRFSIIHMDANREDEEKKKVIFNNEEILWESFYKSFNSYIINELNLSEDKQIGPYFISKDDIHSGVALKKVLNYIYHEINNIYFRYDNSGQIFKSKYRNLEAILRAFETKQIFNDTLNSAILGKA